MRTKLALLAGLLVLSACGPAEVDAICFEPAARRPGASTVARTAARGVVLIVIDTLRADHVEWRAAEGLTPALCSLAQGGLVFSRGYSTSSWTRPAVGSLFCGRYPSELGLHGYEDSLPEDAVTLAESLSASGVKTLAVSANANVGSKWGFERGFNEFVEPEESAFYADDEHGMIPAQVVTQEALDLLDGLEGDEPFFLFLHYTDPHDPYFPHEQLSGPEPPGPFEGSRSALTQLDRLSSDERADAEARIKFLYKSEVQYVDHWIGELAAGMRERGLFEQSVLIVTSDHGEGLWDHGQRAHGKKLFEEQIHVPLLICFPRTWGGEREGRPRSSQA